MPSAVPTPFAAPAPSAGAAADGLAPLAELYVAIKSKPMALLYGPAQAGLPAAADEVTRRLAGPGSDRIQKMVGHPWWANGVARAAVFTAAQEGFVREKIHALMVEAARDHAADRVYVAVLSQISPAEWNDLAALAVQFQLGYVRNDLDDRRGRRLRVSPRLRVIATAEALPPPPWDALVLRQTSLLSWSPRRRTDSGTEEGWPRAALPERFSIDGSIRTPRAALRRLRGLPGWRDDRLKPLLSRAVAADLSSPEEANRSAGEALVYLANAWTAEGNGLLSPRFDLNLLLGSRLAFQLAIAPRLVGRAGP